MTDTLRHRGPDDSGIWLDEAAGIGLGHRRLSILDLSPLGRQPMHSASGRYVICFNGEVFNFARLRAELEPLGHSFRGGSDTEVMLAAIEQWGLAAAVQRFIGMFAFALWDAQNRTLHLVRDRIGIKPLYYGQAGGDFIFGSELKALRTHPDFDSAIDRGALTLYFRHNYIPGPWSIHQGARKLPPGHILTLGCDGQQVLARYWSPEDIWARGEAAPFAGTEAEAASQLEALLTDAVGLRMLADVPLGAFLSGGIDSSLVVALMQAQSTQAVRTFSIGFAEKAHNEAPHAEAVAAHLGTNHTQFMLSQRDLLDVVPLVPRYWDEPFADSSQIPTYAVCKLARQHVTVALSGDGGDELFFGYDRYFHTQRWWRRLKRIPGPLRSVSGLGERLLGQGSGPTLARLSKRLGLFSERNFAAFYSRLISQVHRPGELVLDAPPAPRTPLPGASPGGDLLRDMALWDVLMYLPDDILTKVDRASMAVSLETRVPLLDHRVIEFAASLPTAFKARNGNGKIILKQLLHKHVPRALVERPKMGFGVPISTWLRDELRPWAEDLLGEAALRAEGHLNAPLIRRAWAEHLSGRVDHSPLLWAVLMYSSWRQECQGGG